jgi:hypothetical protein
MLNRGSAWCWRRGDGSVARRAIGLLAVIVSMAWREASVYAGGCTVPYAGDERRLTEALASAAVEAIRLSAWHEGDVVSPVVCPWWEVSAAEAIAVMCEPPGARGGAVWQAMRLGRATPEGARVASVIDGADVDLDRAVGVLVCEAVVPALRASSSLPAELVARMASGVPAPPTNPRADPAVVRRVERMSRAGRLSAGMRDEAVQLHEQLERIVPRAEMWRVRYLAIMEAIAAAADSVEGQAIVAAITVERLALAGWAERSAQSVGGSAARRAPDRVHGLVQRALLERPPCEALARVLVELEPRRAARIESMAVAPDGALLLGRAWSELPESTLDRWRLACGLKRGARGWVGLPATPRKRLPRIRNAPFGISPPERSALGYALPHDGERRALCTTDAAAGLWPRGTAASCPRPRAGRGVRSTRDRRERVAGAGGRGHGHDRRPRLRRVVEPAAPDALHRAGCPPGRAQG